VANQQTLVVIFVVLITGWAVAQTGYLSHSAKHRRITYVIVLLCWLHIEPDQVALMH